MKHRLLLSFVMTTCTLIAAGCATRTDLKEGLLRAVKGADLRGYTLAQSEDDSQATASFTSAAIKDTMTFTGDGTVVVRYRAVHDKKNGTTANYRDDIVRKGRSLTFVITDLGTNRVIGKQSHAIDDPGGGGDDGLRCFTSCSDAKRDFDLNHLPALQDAANRTCQEVRGGYDCCDNPPCADCLLKVTVLVPPAPHLQHILPACEVASLSFPAVFSPGPTLVPLKARFVGGGDNHSLAIAENGAVLAWGSNASGQLGDGTRTTRVHPGAVHGLGSCANSNVVAVAAGRFFSLALKLDGTVLTWGTSTRDDGTSVTQLTPVPIEGLEPGPTAKVFAIAAGASHALALKTDGTVWAWGKNQNGQLGIDPPIANSSKPVQVKGLPDGQVQAIAASGTVSAALTTDGRVFTWGYNAFGQLGIGNNDPQPSPGPVEVKSLGTDVRAIVIGAYSVALKLDGSVFTWGTNSFGSLGNNGTPNDEVFKPVRVIDPGSGIFAIAGGASGSHVLALKDNGTVLAWGANSAGQLGDDSTINRFGRTLVPGLADVVAVAVGGSHSLARKSDGTILAWGSNGSGQLGDGTIQASQHFVDVSVPPGPPITAVSACASHALALRSDGSVLTWGSNGSGQLGNHNPATSFVPVLVKHLPPMKAVACGVGGGGGGHSLALTADGRTVFAWGANTNGQLGDGTKEQPADPVKVAFLNSDSRITAIAAGGLSFSFALKEDGTVWAWGTNATGKLGNGGFIDQHGPIQVQLSGSPVTAIAAGNHGLALKEDGTVWAWGGNSNGQLGIGLGGQQTTPVRIPSPLLDPNLGPRVTAIEAAANYSLALRKGGSVLGWGANASGQLGNGTTTGSRTPVEVSTLLGLNVAAISIDRSEGSSSFATLKDGTLLGFGSNATGQLADGTFESRGDARPIDYPFGPDPDVTVRAGTGFLLVLRQDGRLFAVGTDAFGQLGDGQNSKKNQTPSPVLVLVP